MNRTGAALVLLLAGVGGVVAIAAHYGYLSGSELTGVSEPPGPTPTPTGADSVHVIAPGDKCWELALGQSVVSPGTRVEHGCGDEAVSIDPSEEVVSLSRRPPDWWDLGMWIEVNRVVVRDIRPAPYGGLKAHWADREEKKTLVARLMAPDSGCWTATLENVIAEGCGSRDVSLDVQGDVNVVFERDPPGAWTWCLNLEVDDTVFQTYGPDSNPAYPLTFWYGPTDGSRDTPIVEPVTC